MHSMKQTLRRLIEQEFTQKSFIHVPKSENQDWAEGKIGIAMWLQRLHSCLSVQLWNWDGHSELSQQVQVLYSDVQQS